MHCPKCLSSSFHKDGFVSGKQRYRCKRCDCRFTQAHKHGYDFEKKLDALRLYKEGCGFRRIGRLLRVSNVTVLNWIKAFGEEAKDHILSQPVDVQDMDVIILDELWHYTQKNSEKYGYGLLYLCGRGNSLPSKLVLAVPNHSKHSGED
jgi:transposase-like protein